MQKAYMTYGCTVPLDFETSDEERSELIQNNLLRIIGTLSKERSEPPQQLSHSVCMVSPTSALITIVYLGDYNPDIHGKPGRIKQVI